MNTDAFLLSMPGGAEWVLILIALFSIACPILAVVFYTEAQRLRKENKELLKKLSEKDKSTL